MKYDIKPFEDLVDLGYLRKSEKDSMVLYGYTDQCTFDRHWNEQTRIARGLILDKETGEVIAKPFPKFFNLGEMEETFVTNLPNEPYIVQEKMDGSLGIVFNYQGTWQASTRGSFYSEQAEEANNLLKLYDLSFINSDYTLLVEIIYPENKIIVNYGTERKLVLLAAIHKNTGLDVTLPELENLAKSMHMELAPTYGYTINEMIELQKTLPKDQEGFVVRFESGLRVKIKGIEYLRIAKILSHMSPLSFWETMVNGIVNREYLAQIPEEFKPDFTSIVDSLENLYNKISGEIKVDFGSLPQRASDNYRKDIALFIQKGTIQHAPAIFALLDNKPDVVNKYIMKKIRPTGNNLNNT